MAIMAIMALWLHFFFDFGPFWPFSGGCIFMTFGRFGHVEVAASFLFLAVLAIVGRLHFFIIVCRFGHFQTAAFL